MGLHIGYKCKCQQNLVWAESEVTVGPTKIGHTTGWVMGVMIAVANAVFRTLRDEGRKEESDGE